MDVIVFTPALLHVTPAAVLGSGSVNLMHIRARKGKREIADDRQKGV